MFPGGVCGMAPGCTRDKILSFVGYVINGQAFLILQPYDLYRERFWMIGVNGRYIGKNVWCGSTGNVEIAVPFDFGTSIGSVYACEVGPWDGFKDTAQIPDAQMILEEETTAKRIRIRWRAKYSISSVSGDSQIGSIVVTGARRGRNVEPVTNFELSRGRLYYTIETTNIPTAGDTIVRWFNGSQPVAEGRTNNGMIGGALTCTELNNSGLTITCTLSYTANVKNGAAYIELLWPKSYQIHYSTSALAYPRTPEITFQDKGVDDYFWVTPELAGGNYNYNIVQVDDEGNAETAPSVPSDSPRSVKTPPAAPTVLRVGLERPEKRGTFTTKQINTAIVSLTPTIQAGTDRMLFVTLSYDAVRSITSITHNGVAMTLAYTNTGPLYKTSVYYKAAPTVGTPTLQVVFDVSVSSCVLVGTQYDLVDQVTPFSGAPVVSTGTNTNSLSLAEPAPSALKDNGFLAAFFYGSGAIPSGANLEWGNDAEIAEYQNTGNLLNVALAERRLFNGSAASVSCLYQANESVLMFFVMKGSGTATVVEWKNNEAGCTYKVYYSNANEPINYDTLRTAGPTPLGPTAADATKQAITLPSFAGMDNTTAYNTLAAAFDLEVSQMNAAFITSEASFRTVVAQSTIDIPAAIAAYGSSIGKPLQQIKTAALRELAGLQAAMDSVQSLVLNGDNYKNYVGNQFAQLLAFLSAALNGFSGRYSIGYGAVPGGVNPSNTSGIGSAPDGSSGQAILFSIQDHLLAAALPLVKTGIVRVVVRATKATVEERNDVEFNIEVNGSGVALAKRPNRANINGIRFSGGFMYVVCGVLEENAEVQANSINLSVVAAGLAPSWGSNVALPDIISNYHEIETSFVMPGAGFYDVSVRGVSTSGGTSADYITQRVWYSPAVPTSATNKRGDVARGAPIRPEQED